MKDFRDIFLDIYKCKIYGIVSYIYKLTCVRKSYAAK